MGPLSESGSGQGGLLEWAQAGRPREDEPASGDLCVVLDSPEGTVAAVLDGLGHGPDAAKASALAAQALRLGASDLAGLMQAVHQKLQGSRGAVMSLARLAPAKAGEGILTWSGIGNVEGILYRAPPQGREVLLLKGGTLGVQIPPPRISSIPLRPGDILLLATDGIDLSQARDFRFSGPLLPQAESLLKDFAKADDDALVFLARFNGRL